MKILILVLSYNDNGLYTKFLNAQKETWDSIQVDGVNTYYYFGNHTDNVIENDQILTKSPEGLMNCTHKTIECFKQILTFDFDYIFRTNSSSYVDKLGLKNYLIDKPKNKFYSGIIGNCNDIFFCSGSGYFLSKDLVKLIVENENIINHSLIDDVAIGQFLGSNEVCLINSERFDVIESNNIPLNFFHYRLKTTNRDNDIYNMKLIFSEKCNL